MLCNETEERINKLYLISNRLLPLKSLSPLDQMHSFNTTKRCLRGLERLKSKGSVANFKKSIKYVDILGIGFKKPLLTVVIPGMPKKRSLANGFIFVCKVHERTRPHRHQVKKYILLQNDKNELNSHK